MNFGRSAFPRDRKNVKMKEALFNLGFDGLVRPLAKQYANKPKQINKITEKERETKNLFTV